MRGWGWAGGLLLAGALLVVGAITAIPVRAQSDAELEALNQQVTELRRAWKYRDAIPFAERLAEATRVQHGSDDPKYATALNNLAELLRDTNRLSEAEQLFRRALAIDEKSFGPEHPNVARDLNSLAELLRDTERPVEAEPLMRRALAIDEKSLGLEHPSVASDLNNLAWVLHATNRLSEAVELMRRALAIDEKSLGPEHPSVARDLTHLAVLLMNTTQVGEAEPLYRRALAISEKSVGPEHPDVARDLGKLADLLHVIGQDSEAEPLHWRALAIDEKSFGPEHHNVAIRLNSLARLLADTNRLGEAVPLMRRAVAIVEKSLGSEHSDVATGLSNLAVLLAGEGDWVQAAALGRRAKPILIRRKKVLVHNGWAFRAHARSLHRAHAGDAGARGEGFELAQWALQTGAADALAQMGVRFAKGTGGLAELVRQRQDLLARRQREMRRLDRATGRADPQGVEEARTAVTSLDQRLDAIDARLANEFKDYAELSNSRPLTLAEVQALLGPQEALVLFLDVPRLLRLKGASLAWVVTKTQVRWLELPPVQFSSVRALRCGLDHTLWHEGRCALVMRGTTTKEQFVDGRLVQMLPFDAERAHELYKGLLGPIEDLIKGKHLLIVPSGELISLPFGVLVTEAPEAAIPASFGDYRKIAWLGLRQPITVLPSVSALKSLRQFAKTSRASKAYIGVGNPLLDGQQDHPKTGERSKQRAELALANQVCPKTWSERVAELARVPLVGFAQLFRGATADIEAVRRWEPLPETADEVCEVGRRLGVGESDILLGERATETALKALSEAKEGSGRGRLSDYAIVHFATHGALTGQVKDSAEPGLILTPPAKGTSDAGALERDDGFLTASEIATLKLDADWVVLSACNTAGAGGESAEALSGLARAFFYAGARALLVSHWEVASDASVKLTTRAFAELKANPKLGRAEALRTSMRALFETGKVYEAHPSIWAPFVVVGEGAR